MTLTELIVASVLVGIVTLGLVAAEQAVRMSRQSSNRDAQISAQLQAAMTRLTQQANATVGDTSDTGIYQYSSGEDLSICFRSANGDANSYADDRWNCWNTNTSTGLLTNCEGIAGLLPPTSCAAAGPIQWGTLTFNATTYTTFFTVVDDTGATIPPVAGVGEIIRDRKIAYIQLELTSRADPSRPEHPINNPQYTLTSRISPVGLSR